MHNGASYERRECAGRVLLAKPLKSGRTFKVWEVRLLGDKTWPTDDELLATFGGDSCFAGEVRRIGKVGKVTVNFD